MIWVLKDTVSGKYFKLMASIGPALCGDIGSAQKFESREAAVLHPAYSFPLTCFEPEEVEDLKEMNDDSR